MRCLRKLKFTAEEKRGGVYTPRFGRYYSIMEQDCRSLSLISRNLAQGSIGLQLAGCLDFFEWRFRAAEYVNGSKFEPLKLD